MQQMLAEARECLLRLGDRANGFEVGRAVLKKITSQEGETSIVDSWTFRNWVLRWTVTFILDYSFMFSVDRAIGIQCVC